MVPKSHIVKINSCKYCEYGTVFCMNSNSAHSPEVVLMAILLIRLREVKAKVIIQLGGWACS